MHHFINWNPPPQSLKTFSFTWKPLKSISPYTTCQKTWQPGWLSAWGSSHSNPEERCSVYTVRIWTLSYLSTRWMFFTLLTMTQSHNMVQSKHTSCNCNKFYKSLLILVPCCGWPSLDGCHNSPLGLLWCLLCILNIEQDMWRGQERSLPRQALRNCKSGQEWAGRHGPTTAELSLGTGPPSHPKYQLWAEQGSRQWASRREQSPCPVGLITEWQRQAHK